VEVHNPSQKKSSFRRKTLKKLKTWKIEMFTRNGKEGAKEKKEKGFSKKNHEFLKYFFK